MRILSILLFAACLALLAVPALTDAPVEAAPKNKNKAKNNKNKNKNKNKKNLRFNKDWRDVAHPLIVASYDGDVRAVVAELKKKDADVNVTLKGQFRDAARLKGLVGGTPLLFAAWQGQTRVIATLLRYKVDVNVRDVHQRTPLHWAALNAHSQSVQLLLKAGAEVNAKDKDGRTPLFLTIDDKCKAVLREAGGTE